jgi:hypothetical protein
MRGLALRWARSPRLRNVLLFAALMTMACSGDKGTEPDPAIAPFVGDWAAQSLVLTSQANPDISGDIIQLGATFTLNVQPSGQYTAILLYAGQSLTEIGSIEVSGSTVTLRQTFPSASTSAGVFSFEGGHLIIDANTEFDFNQDGTPESALAHFDLVKK